MTEDEANGVDRLRDDIRGVHVPEPSADREAVYVKLGMALPVLGLVLIGIAWYQAAGTAYVADQIPILISGAVLGLGLILVGAAVWVRYSTARVLRVWLARDLIERQRQTDQLVQAMRAGESDPPAAMVD